jgi:hypothetical protein
MREVLTQLSSLREMEVILLCERSGRCVEEIIQSSSLCLRANLAMV